MLDIIGLEISWFIRKAIYKIMEVQVCKIVKLISLQNENATDGITLLGHRSYLI